MFYDSGIEEYQIELIKNNMSLDLWRAMGAYATWQGTQ